jgi:hypothetical protein
MFVMFRRDYNQGHQAHAAVDKHDAGTKVNG